MKNRIISIFTLAVIIMSLSACFYHGHERHEGHEGHHHHDYHHHRDGRGHHDR